MKLIIRNISDPTPSGKIGVITGDFYDCDNLKVKASVLNEKGEYENFSDAEIIKFTEKHVITFKLPDLGNNAYALYVENNDMSSEIKYINLPEIKWLSQNEIECGGVLRIVGTCLVNLNCYGDDEGYSGYVKNNTRVKIINEDFTEYNCEVIKASAYDVQIKIPDNLANGTYTLKVHNGFGGELGWSKPFECIIKEKEVWPETVFNAADFGMINTDHGRMERMPQDKTKRDFCFLGAMSENKYDSTIPLQKALDAAEKNGGGIVVVPNGRYRFYGGVRIPRRTVLRGESKNRVFFELPTGLEVQRNGEGFGTAEDGLKIDIFIKGDGDFTIENINILSVYSPLIIGAPCLDKPKPLTNKTKHSAWRAFYNILDYDREADNITIKDCNIFQEPTYMSQQKTKSDPIFDEILYAEHGKETRISTWTAVAIKGSNIKIVNNTIEGGGAPITLLGTQNTIIKDNELYAGAYKSNIIFFSADYFGDDDWNKMCRNIIVEGNLLDARSNTANGTVWIMEDHLNYLFRENIIARRFWYSDNEGLCFHLWGENMNLKIEKHDNNKLVIDREILKYQYETYPEFREILTADGNFKKDAVKNYECIIFGGKGFGQYKDIVGCEDNILYFEDGWDTQLDSDSRINISKCHKAHNSFLLCNTINDCGRALSFWGDGFNTVIDGNTLRNNAGIAYDDLSKYHTIKRWWMQFAGAYYNQILYNKVSDGRGYGGNIATVGGYTGGIESGMVSLIVRGNKLSNDVSLCAWPRMAADNGLNYLGIVFEDNTVENTHVGCYIGEGVEAILKNNKMKNVDIEIEGDTSTSEIL